MRIHRRGRTIDPRVLLCLCGLVVAGCAPAPVRVERAWVRDADSAGTTAAYFRLVNDGADSIRLTRIASSCARVVQMHETVREDGRAAMREVRDLDVAPRAEVDFVPGGHHVMLVSTVRRLAPGDTVSLVLQLADGRSLVARAEVRP